MFPIFFIFATDILVVSAKVRSKQGGVPVCPFVLC